MKKSFTLLEVVISITIFLIIFVFMYKALDDTRLGNNIFEKHISKNQYQTSLYKIFLEDIAELKPLGNKDVQGDFSIKDDKEKNSIFIFKTNNSYFDIYYEYVTYMISSTGSLIRIESKEEFQKEKSSIEFFKNSYIYKLLDDIEKFVVLKREEDNRIVFIIKQKGKEEVIYSMLKMNGKVNIK